MNTNSISEFDSVTILEVAHASHAKYKVSERNMAYRLIWPIAIISDNTGKILNMTVVRCAHHIFNVPCKFT